MSEDPFSTRSRPPASGCVADGAPKASTCSLEVGRVAGSTRNDVAYAQQLEEFRKELESLVAEVSSKADAHDVIRQVEKHAIPFSTDVAIQSLMLQLKERLGEPGLRLDEWSDLSRRFPTDAGVAHQYVCQLVKAHREEEARRVIDRCVPDWSDSMLQGLVRANLLADARFHEESDDLFRDLIRQYDHRNVRIAYAKRLNKRGLLKEAIDTLSPIIPLLKDGSKASQLAQDLMDSYAFFRALEPHEELGEVDVKILAMKHAILHFRERARRRIRARAKSVALVTGSLGPGGAERQLTRLACRLQDMRMDGHRCTSTQIGKIGDVEVIVKQHSASPTHKNAAFLLRDLLDAGVPVKEAIHLPAAPVPQQGDGDPALNRLLEYLPAQVHYGVARLCPYFRDRQFDVVSLWQDGTCLQGALAALLAGVPMIHLVFRGLPPNLRASRFRPEYAVLYRAMAQIPGVLFISNSRVVAQEYADWLGISVEKFRILYNGVPELSASPSEDDADKWSAFAESTHDATETIGGVFRMEPDKRPLLWIRLAQRYLRHRPKARFVIIGDGQLFESVVGLVQDLGIAHRVLLVGLSSHVGFWYSKMDVKVLLSRYEGLPNVLIEAQMLGVSTVSTPAGGASECFMDGQTGYLLSSVEHPDLDEACERIASLVDAVRVGHGMRELAKRHAMGLFAVDVARDTFISYCHSTEDAGRAGKSPGASSGVT